MKALGYAFSEALVRATAEGELLAKQGNDMDAVRVLERAKRGHDVPREPGLLGQLAQVVPVEPAELVEVEHRPDRVDPRPVEGLDHLLRLAHAVGGVALGVLDDQLATVIVVGIGEKERRRQVRANAVRCAGHLADVIGAGAGRVDQGRTRRPARLRTPRHRPSGLTLSLRASRPQQATRRFHLNLPGQQRSF